MNVWRDVVFGVRLLFKQRGFAAVALIALVLGIGPNVAIFSVIWATLLGSSWPEVERVVVVWSKINGQRDGIPGDDLLAYRRASTLFQNIEANGQVEYNTSTADEPVVLTGAIVTPTMNQTTWRKSTMLLGREFRPEDSQAGREHVVILFHKTWVAHFHSDPDIVGKKIYFDSVPYTIIGVRTARSYDTYTQFYQVPYTLTPGPDGHVPFWSVLIGRLKPGVTIPQAEAELNAITRHLVKEQHPKEWPQDWKVEAVPERTAWLSPTFFRNIRLLMGIVALVLLIACANVANLLLARGSARKRELAVRSSVGASSAQLFRQLLVESLVLALGGGMLGIALAWALLKAILALAPGDRKQLIGGERLLELHWPVLLFAIGVTVVSGVLFGCVPAWQAARLNLSEALKDGARSVLGGRGSLQRVLVVCEFALAITLLTAAGLAIHSFSNLMRVDLGIRTDHVLTSVVNVQRNRFTKPEQVLGFYRPLLQNVAATPGVAQAALTTAVPLEGNNQFPFQIAGRGSPTDLKHAMVADFASVTPSYLDAMKILLVRGQRLTDANTAATEPVVMVNESFVRRYFANEDPLRQSLLFGLLQIGADKVGPAVAHRVIGIFHDVRNGATLTDQTQPQIYACFWQTPWPGVRLVTRTSHDPEPLIRDISKAVHRAAPDVALKYTRTMDQIVNESIWNDRFGMVLFGGFAGIALILAAVGIYGVMSFAVGQRRHEIGLRMALGAGAGQVRGLVLKDGMLLALIGLAIGGVSSFAVGRLMHSTLYAVGMIDPVSFGSVAAVLLASAALACYIPALRATKVDPMTALRGE